MKTVIIISGEKISLFFQGSPVLLCPQSWPFDREHQLGMQLCSPHLLTCSWISISNTTLSCGFGGKGGFCILDILSSLFVLLPWALECSCFIGIGSCNCSFLRCELVCDCELSIRNTDSDSESLLQSPPGFRKKEWILKQTNRTLNASPPSSPWSCTDSVFKRKLVVYS